MMARLLVLFLVLNLSAAATAQRVVWHERFQSSYAGPLRASVLDVDGNLWVLETFGSVPQRMLMKHDPTGVELLATDFGWGGLVPHGMASLVADSAGGVFLAGSVGSAQLPGLPPAIGGFSDAVVVKVDPAGAIVWGTRIGGNGSDGAYDLRSDGQGGCFVVGGTNSSAAFGGSSVGVFDAFVAHLDAAGAVDRVTRFGYPGFESAGLALALDGAGGVFVGGYQQDAVGFSGPRRLLVRVGANGALLWDRGGFADLLTVSKLEPDGAGGVVAFGWHTGGLGQPLLHGGTTFERFNSAGQRQWLHQVPPFPQYLESMALHSGTVYGALRDSLYRIDVNTGTPQGTTLPLAGFDVGSAGIYHIAVDSQDGLALNGLDWAARASLRDASAPGCSGNPNSTGRPATSAAAGEVSLSSRSLTLFANGVPPQAPGYFLAARTVGSVPNAGGSQGTLCLGGPIGRFNRPGEVLSASPAGGVALVIAPLAFPSAMGSVAVAAGETWHFQLWYRDVGPPGTSNFSGSFSLQF